MTRDAWILKGKREVSLLMGCGGNHVHSFAARKGFRRRRQRRPCWGIASAIPLTEVVLAAAGAGGISGRRLQPFPTDPITKTTLWCNG